MKQVSAGGGGRAQPAWWVRSSVAAVERMPSAMAYSLASVVARLVWSTSPGRRALYRRRAGLVLGGASTDRLEMVARESWRNTVLHYLDAIRVGRQTSHDGLVVGAHHLRDALESGRGVVLATPHLGAPELGMLALRDAGFEVVVMGGRPNPRPVTSVRPLMRGGRGRAGVTILGPDLPGLRAASSHLRRRGIVAVFADVDVPGTGVEVSFVSHRALMPTLPVALALRTGAQLIASRALRIGSGTRCVVTIEPPLALPTAGGRRERVRIGTELLARSMADSVRLAPEQWYREAHWVSTQP